MSSAHAPPLPVLTNALLETTETGLRLTTTDLEVAIRCEIAAQVGNARRHHSRRPAGLPPSFASFPPPRSPSKSDAKNVATLALWIELFQNLRSRQGRVSRLPVLQGRQDLHAQAGRTPKDGLRKTSYAISVDETRYVLNGILFSFKENKLTLVATDGRRLALFDCDMEFPRSHERDFIVPTKAVTELQRLLGEDGEVQISVAENLVSFELNGAQLVSKLVEGNYPNYRQVIPGEAKERVHARARSLPHQREAAWRCSAATRPVRCG